LKSPASLIASLFEDLKRMHPDAKGLDRDLTSIQNRVKHEGYGFLAIALPTLGRALDKALDEGLFTCPIGFKSGRLAIPLLFSGMLCDVFHPRTGEILERPRFDVVLSLRQALLQFKKLCFSDDRDLELDRRAKAKFFEDDHAASLPHQLDERQLFILDCVSRVTLSDLDDFRPSELDCRHGPGAVYERSTPNGKWSSLTEYSSELEVYGFDCFYASMASEFEKPSTQNPHGASGDIARLVSVPKNTSSRRTITVEPVVRQYIQQGLNAHLRQSIERCPVLRNCLALTNQTPNQELALEGSQTGYWCTIDLKSASDKLSVGLVKTVFGNRPQFLREILRARTPFILDNGKTRPLSKYAGMGNATTFPVQSVIFATLAICALLDGKRPSYGEIERVSRRVRVFGDDIIVPTHTLPQVRSWLTLAGLTLNEDKTFSGENFRESCGVDGFKGVDVTPVYLKHPPGSCTFRRPDIVEHMVSVLNSLWLRGYYAMSQLLQSEVESVLRLPLPLVTDRSSVLGLRTRQQVRVNQKWHSDHQRYYFKGIARVGSTRVDPLSGYAALLKFYHRGLAPSWDRPLECSSEHLEKSPVRGYDRLVRVWVAD